MASLYTELLYRQRIHRLRCQSQNICCLFLFWQKIGLPPSQPVRQRKAVGQHPEVVTKSTSDALTMRKLKLRPREKRCEVLLSACPRVCLSAYLTILLFAYLGNSVLMGMLLWAWLGFPLMTCYLLPVLSMTSCSYEMILGITDIIARANFGYDRLRSFWVAGG